MTTATTSTPTITTATTPRTSLEALVDRLVESIFGGSTR